MKKHLKRFLSMMMAVLLCFGIVGDDEKPKENFTLPMAPT